MSMAAAGPRPAAAAEVGISVQGAGKTYRARSGELVEALSPVALDIRAGEFVALVGPSGCGKSTLLNCMAGLDHPSVGDVLVGGRNMRGGPQPEIGYIFQKETLLPWYTVEHNVRLGQDYRRRGRDADAARLVDHLLEVTELSSVRKAYPFELSGGMRRRAALCAALAVEPRVLLMDEPFGALDTFTRAGLQQYLLDLWSETRQTGVFVTHDLEEAVTLADRIVVLSRRPGRILDVVDVPLPRPRDVFQIKQDDRFSQVYQHTWKTLSGEFARAARA